MLAWPRGLVAQIRMIGVSCIHLLRGRVSRDYVTLEARQREVRVQLRWYLGLL